jgi:ubiquinone/menaquinone biosynthesis C-methylase UbiE
MRDHILQTWNSQAARFGQSHEASWGDLNMISLEVEQISNHVERGNSILDIGCANGYSTRMVIERTAPEMVLAADFSPEMVEQARKLLSGLPVRELRVFQTDVRSIGLPSNTVDVCYAIRTLINLPTWADQLQGIEECLRVTRPGGKVLLSEGFWEPLMRLNALRQILGLQTLVEHDFNRYLKQTRLEDWLTMRHLQYDIIEFSSMYYLGTRLARELATDHESFAGFSNPINSEFGRLARKYPRCGGVGVQQLVVIVKP